MNKSIDIYTLQGCSHCETLKKTLGAMANKDKALPIGQTHQIIERNGVYYEKNTSGESILEKHIGEYPYIEIKSSQGMISLSGTKALSYIQSGGEYVKNRKACPHNKMRKCIGDPCAYWCETQVKGIIFGGCSIPIMANNMITIANKGLLNDQPNRRVEAEKSL